MDLLIPEIEENIPLPKNASEAFPDLSPQEELNMRANVVVLLSNMTGQPISPTKENAKEAQALARQMADDPKNRPVFAKYPNETLAFLAGMVAQMNVSIVEELSDFKLYVVNKLVHEIEHTRDPKARLTAIRNLGEVDGVDAFKKRSEVTHRILSAEEVEKELLETLQSLEDKVIDVEAREVLKHESNSDA
jgi:hypothetical protein